MKKIGIITYHRAISYGAQLQAFATATFLRDVGYDAEVIDYSDIGEGKRPGIRFGSIKSLITSCISFILSVPNEGRRRKKFCEFQNNFIPKSKERYLSQESLIHLEDKYDCIITGSDQVWCPTINQGDANFLLKFVKDFHKKVAYAASFGVSSLPETIFAEYKKCLADFKKILIRESEGQLLVQQMLGYKPNVVLDPTFLISTDIWNRIAICPFDKAENYILCFKIIVANDIYYKYIDELHRLTGYKIVHLDTSYRYKPVKGQLFSTGGPREFIGLIKNASIVVTNSFHGTVFSILYRRNFFTILNENGRNSRLLELGRKFHLSNRLISSKDSLPGQYDIPIDYESINKLVETEISKSKELLLGALE